MTILYIRITTSCNATRIYIVHQQMLVICSNKRKIAAFFSILLLRHTHSARPMHTAHCNTRSHWLNYMEEKWLGWWTAYAIDTWSVFFVVVSTLWMCWFVQKVDVEYGDKSWLSPITIPYPKRGHFSLLPFFFLFFVLLRSMFRRQQVRWPWFCFFTYHELVRCYHCLDATRCRRARL